MKLSPEERADRRASFRQMGGAQKVDYLYTYYKLPILMVLIVLFLLGAGAQRLLTKKEVLLYTAYVNVSVSESLEQTLNTGFVSASGLDPQKYEVYVDHALYLSADPTAENHQYEYASQMKIMAAIASQQLDLVLMNQEAYDILSQSGYLRDLSTFLSQNKELDQQLKPYLTTNTVILEDNAIEYTLDEADTYQAVTEEVANGLNITQFPLLQASGGFSGTVYLGVMADGPRLSSALEYIEYLATA